MPGEPRTIYRTLPVFDEDARASSSASASPDLHPAWTGEDGRFLATQALVHSSVSSGDSQPSRRSASVSEPHALPGTEELLPGTEADFDDPIEVASARPPEIRVPVPLVFASKAATEPTQVDALLEPSQVLVLPPARPRINLSHNGGAAAPRPPGNAASVPKVHMESAALRRTGMLAVPPRFEADSAEDLLVPRSQVLELRPPLPKITVGLHGEQQPLERAPVSLPNLQAGLGAPKSHAPIPPSPIEGKALEVAVAAAAAAATTSPVPCDKCALYGLTLFCCIMCKHQKLDDMPPEVQAGYPEFVEQQQKMCEPVVIRPTPNKPIKRAGSLAAAATTKKQKGLDVVVTSSEPYVRPIGMERWISRGTSGNTEQTHLEGYFEKR